MAHITKYKHNQVGGNLLAHMERNRGDRSKYGNESIDASRTHLNYDLTEGHRWVDEYRKGYDVGEDYKRKWEALQKEQKRKIRPDAVGLGAVIVTLPERYRDLQPHQQAEFFEETYRYLHQKFGSRDNEIYACVHMDETTPHIHYGFIPVDEERQISAKRVLDRNTFQHFHDELDKHLQKNLRWYEGGIKLDTLEDSKREYVNIDKLKDQPRLYRDVRENNNILNPVVREMKEGKSVKLNRRQAQALKRQQELSSNFAYTIEASEDVARQRFSFDYRKEQAEAKERILETREDAVNARWNRAIAKEKELSTSLQEKDISISRLSAEIEELKKENTLLKEQLKPLSEVRKNMVTYLATHPEELNKETRSKQTEDLLEFLRKSKLFITKKEVQEKREEIQKKEMSKTPSLRR